TWAPNNPADLVSFYNVYRGTILTATAKIASTSINNYIDDSFVNTTTYYYNVTAVNNSLLESYNSATITVFPAGNVPPHAPIVNASCPGDGNIYLSWDQDYAPGIIYNIFRAAYAAAALTQIKSTTANAYVDSV